MKKILALGLGLSLIMSLGTANASDVAQKGDTDIFFNHGNIRRNGRQFFEYQRVVNYKDKDISLLHMRVKGDDYVSAKLVHNLTGIEIPLEQLDIKTDYVLPDDRIDKWFKYDPVAWKKLADYIGGKNEQDRRSNTTELNCVLSLPNGKTRDVDFRIAPKDIYLTSLASHQELQKSAKAKADAVKKADIIGNHYNFNDYYQPDLQVFFPNKTFKEVKELLRYNLNPHGKDGRVTNSFTENTFDDDMRVLVPVWHSTYSTFIWFNEKPEGTWLNFNKCILYNDKLHCYFDYEKFNQDVLEAIEKTYTDFYGKRNYGFKTKKYKYCDKDKIKISSIGSNTELKPLADALANKELVRVIGVNGRRFNISGLLYDVYTKYQPGDKPVTFTFIINKTKQEFNVTITPEIIPPEPPAFDYEEINNKYANKTSATLKPCELAAYSGEPFIDILDPFTSRNEPVKYQF